VLQKEVVRPVGVRFEQDEDLRLHGRDDAARAVLELAQAARALLEQERLVPRRRDRPAADEGEDPRADFACPRMTRFTFSERGLGRARSARPQGRLGLCLTVRGTADTTAQP
jgi:hypothetical protein